MTKQQEANRSYYEKNKERLRNWKGMKTKPKNDWLEALQSIINVDVPGQEWKTRTQLEAEIGVTRGPMSRALKRLADTGKVEKKMFTVKSTKGKGVAVIHYRLIK